MFKSSNATLTNIQVSQGVISPEFSKDVKEYTVYQIKDTINKVKITATCAEGDCSAVPTGGKSVSGTTVTLNMGENKVVLDVTSEDGKNTETYILNIIRGETVYNSARLGELSFGDYVLNPVFKPETKKYALTVPNEVTTLTQIIKYATEDPEAKELVSVEVLDGFEIESKEDYEMLSDMIVAACKKAYDEIDKTTEEKMSKYQALLGGMGSFF